MGAGRARHQGLRPSSGQAVIFSTLLSSIFSLPRKSPQVSPLRCDFFVMERTSAPQHPSLSSFPALRRQIITCVLKDPPYTLIPRQHNRKLVFLSAACQSQGHSLILTDNMTLFGDHADLELESQLQLGGNYFLFLFNLSCQAATRSDFSFMLVKKFQR